MADILNKLNSANYITVKVTDNAVINGNNLLAAYALAKTTNPNGTVKSSTNRLDIILPPATYDLGTQSLILDTQFIDIIGSTNNRNNHYIKSNVGISNRGTVMQTANNVQLFNLTIENTNTTFAPTNNTSTDPSAYFPDSNLPLTYIENVIFLGRIGQTSFGAKSMRFAINYSGTYVNCTGGDFSFGGFSQGNTSVAVSGTFINCTGGNFSFGGTNSTPSAVSPLLNGTFTNCIGGGFSFGGFSTLNSASGATLSGTFTSCTGGDYSFGGAYTINNSILNGNFTNCTGGNFSFGANNSVSNSILSGTFINCLGGLNSF